MRTQLIHIVQQRRLARQLLQRSFDAANAIRDAQRLLLALRLWPAEQVLQPLQPRLQQRIREQDSLVVLIHVYGDNGCVVSEWHVNAIACPERDSARIASRRLLERHWQLRFRHRRRLPLRERIYTEQCGCKRSLCCLPHDCATQGAVIPESMANYSAIASEPYDEPMSASTGSLRGRRWVHGSFGEMDSR